MLASLFRRFGSSRISHEEAVAADLYASIVSQARQPGFFASLGVPDSVDGRYELIMLHGAAVINRLKDHGDKAEAVNQALFDALFTDVDDNLRELGVGDLRVGSKVRSMAQSLHGRAVAFEQALADPNPETLEDVIDRNTYATVSPDQAQIKAMADYYRQLAAKLSQQPLTDLMAGKVEFVAAPDGAS